MVVVPMVLVVSVRTCVGFLAGVVVPAGSGVAVVFWPVAVALCDRHKLVDDDRLLIAQYPWLLEIE